MKNVFLALALFAFSVASPASAKTLRVLTYNIHHGEGRDGKVDLERIAALIKAQKADIVALQEVDRGVARTARRDLPAELAKLTGMTACFEKNIAYQGGEYGNAILTRFPILETTNTHYKMLREHEQRGLLQAMLNIDGRKVLFMSTHLDYRKDDAERLMNVAQIREALAKHPGTPAILCGDFNETPAGRTYERLSAILTDVWEKAGSGKGLTFSSVTPIKRIDYIWISKGVRAHCAWIPESTASDHLPVAVEISFE